MVRSATWLLAARGCGVIGGVIAAVYIARVLGPTDYGMLALASMLVAILTIVADCGLSPSVARFINDRVERPADLRKILWVGIFLKTTTLAITSVVVWIAIPLLSRWLRAPALIDIGVWIILLLALSEAAKTLAKLFEGMGQMGLYARAQAAQAIVYPIASIWFVSQGWGVRGAIGGLSLALALHILLGAVLFVRIVRQHSDRSGLKCDISCSSRGFVAWGGTILAYSLPLILISAGTYLYRRCDFIMIQYFLDSQDMGFYNIQFRLMMILHVPVMVLASVLVPRFSASSGQSAEGVGVLRRSLRYTLLVYTPLGTIIGILATPLVGTLFGAEYLPAVSVVRVFAIFFLPVFALSTIVVQALHYRGLAKYRAYVLGASAVVNVALNVFMIPRYGILGAAISTQLTYMPTAILYFRRAASDFRLSMRHSGIALCRVVAADCVMACAMLPLAVVLRPGLQQLLWVGLGSIPVFILSAWIFGAINVDDIRFLRAAVHSFSRKAVVDNAVQ